MAVSGNPATWQPRAARFPVSRDCQMFFDRRKQIIWRSCAKRQSGGPGPPDELSSFAACGPTGLPATRGPRVTEAHLVALGRRIAGRFDPRSGGGGGGGGLGATSAVIASSIYVDRSVRCDSIFALRSGSIRCRFDPNGSRVVELPVGPWTFCGVNCARAYGCAGGFPP